MKATILKTLMILSLLITISSCSKDDDGTSETITKEYPAEMVHQWDGFLRATDFGNSPQTQMRWQIKANGGLEVQQMGDVFLEIPIQGEWYMQGSIFTAIFTDNEGVKNTFQLIKSTEYLFMVGFRGLNGEVAGDGRIEIIVV